MAFLFRMGACPLECSGHGTCDYIVDPGGATVDGVCTCQEGTTGDGCQFDSCPNNCTHGTCDGKGDDMMCVCDGTEYNGELRSLQRQKQIQTINKISKEGAFRWGSEVVYSVDTMLTGTSGIRAD